jgi:hypothetical protein
LAKDATRAVAKRAFGARASPDYSSRKANAQLPQLGFA